MKKNLLPYIFLAVIFLPACDGWVYVVPTFPAPPPTPTRSIFTPTPVFLTATNTATIFTPTVTETASLTAVDTPTAFTEAPTATETSTNLPPVSPVPGGIIIELMGCNTSLDLMHGMGEVTNGFVKLKNATGGDLADLCATMYALDEGRAHPDKTVCVPALGNGYQVTLKLTVDSTYNKETPIQVEVKSGESLLARIGQPSCQDIGLLAPALASLLTPVAIP